MPETAKKHESIDSPRYKSPVKPDVVKENDPRTLSKGHISKKLVHDELDNFYRKTRGDWRQSNRSRISKTDKKSIDLESIEDKEAQVLKESKINRLEQSSQSDVLMASVKSDRAFEEAGNVRLSEERLVEAFGKDEPV